MYSLRSLVTHFSVKLNISLSTSHYCFCFVMVPPVHITFSKSVYSRIKIMWPEVFQVEVTRLLFTCKRLHGLLFSQQQGGTTGKENEVKKRQQKGRAQDSPSGIRASLDCSAPAWVQPTLSSAASGFRNSVHIWRSSTGMQQQDLGVWAPLDCFLPFLKLWFWTPGLWFSSVWSKYCTEIQGWWICHRWKGGERQAAVGCKEKRSPGKISGNCVLWEPLCLGAVRAQFACISTLKTTNDSLYKNAMHVCTAFTYSAHLAVW